MMHVIAPSTMSSVQFLSTTLPPNDSETSSIRAIVRVPFVAPSTEEQEREHEVGDKDQDDRVTTAAVVDLTDAGRASARRRAPDTTPTIAMIARENERLEEPFDHVAESRSAGAPTR